MDADTIIKIAPGCSLGWAASLMEAMEKWHIDSKVRQDMFLAQCAHESRGFSKFEENLNYSAEGLMKTWPTRFPHMEVAGHYARQPEKIANYVYSNRLGNGSEASGDGWRFRGRGPIQITGRVNYRRASAALGFNLESMPTEVALPKYGSLTAAWFWQTNGLNELADKGDFFKVTVRINGGTIGWQDRNVWYEKFKGEA